MGSERTVVFVCEHGAAKSVIAAALLQRLAAGAREPIRAIARGTEPAAEIPANVAVGLLDKGIDVRAVIPSRVTKEDLARAWRIVSFGPDLTGLLPTGGSFETWSGVPAVSDGFPAARDAILSRVNELIARSTP